MSVARNGKASGHVIAEERDAKASGRVRDRGSGKFLSILVFWLELHL
jgi:hypothetical protein